MPVFDPLGIGQMQSIIYKDMAMLHIKFKGMKHAKIC